MTNEKGPSDWEKPEVLIHQIVSDLDSKHSDVVEITMRLGHTRNRLLKTQAVWASLAGATVGRSEAAGLYQGAADTLKALGDEVGALGGAIAYLRDQTESVYISAGTVAAVTGSTAVFSGTYALPDDYYPPTDQDPYKHEGYSGPVWSIEQHQDYAGRFSRFDPALGRVYQEILETLYATRADPERAALYLMRQAFDALFGQLAPDDELRQSPIWKPKQEGEAEFHRDERLGFALDKHVKDAARARTLAANMKHTIRVYKALNRAHDHGEMNRQKAVTALTQTKQILEEWADAIRI